MNSYVMLIRLISQANSRSFEHTDAKLSLILANSRIYSLYMGHTCFSVCRRFAHASAMRVGFREIKFTPNDVIYFACKGFVRMPNICARKKNELDYVELFYLNLS